MWYPSFMSHAPVPHVIQISFMYGIFFFLLFLHFYESMLNVQILNLNSKTRNFTDTIVITLAEIITLILIFSKI